MLDFFMINGLLPAIFAGTNPPDKSKTQENLEIWDVKTLQLVHAFVQRKQHEW